MMYRPIVYNELVLTRRDLAGWRALALASLVMAFLFMGMFIGSIVKGDAMEARRLSNDTPAHTPAAALPAGGLAKANPSASEAFDFQD